MANSPTIGKAYVQILPTMEGTTSNIVGELKKPAKEAGTSAGQSAGSNFASSLKSTITKVVAGLAIGATIKKAFDVGADLQQSIGGVQTLFKSNAAEMQKLAMNAYKTAGVSANKYMEQATSFSASLIASLGGDTAKAVQYTDRIMTDMSDNANKFGTDIGSIQTAYQGFAKGNYTMLDNLKLGFGGTKEEMARLISSASKMTGIQKELGVTVKDGQMDFANISSAISVYQKYLDITGTTQKEASTTFSGSLGQMKSAWENFLGSLTMNGQEGVNVQDSIGPLIDSIETFLFGNLVPMAARLIVALAQALPEIVKQAFSSISTALSEAIAETFGVSIDAETIERLLQGIAVALGVVAAATMGVNLAMTILSANPIILEIEAVVLAIAALIACLVDLYNHNAAFKQGVDAIWNAIVQMFTIVMAAILSIVVPIFQQIFNVVTTIFNVLKPFFQAFFDFLTALFTTGFNIIKGIVTFVFGGIYTFISTYLNMLRDIFSFCWNFLKNSTTGAWNFISSAIENPLNRAKDFVRGVIDAIKGFFNFSISWPHIPMPHFSIRPRGWHVGDLLKGSIPKLNVSWYAKAMDEPYMLQKATIFGAGEKGDEVVYGHAQLMNDIRDAVGTGGGYTENTYHYDVHITVVQRENEDIHDLAKRIKEEFEQIDDRDLAAEG